MKQIIVNKCLECPHINVGTINHMDYGWMSTFYCELQDDYVNPEAIDPDCPLDDHIPDKEGGK